MSYLTQNSLLTLMQSTQSKCEKAAINLKTATIMHTAIIEGHNRRYIVKLKGKPLPKRIVKTCYF